MSALETKLSGFKCCTETATRTSKFGRPSGGLAVYFKEMYEHFVKRIDVGFKYGITLEIQAVLNKVPTKHVNLILVCVYLPPENSTAYEDETDGVIILKEKLIDLKARFPDHMVIVAGDLNARIGSIQDYIDDNVQHMFGMQWYEPDNFDLPRCAKDTVVNNFGRSLIELCTELDIHVLNGRAAQDCPGQYTNINESGCSTVDYFMVETPLYESVVNFEVSEFPVSNHMPVQCTFDLHVDNVTQSVTEQGENVWYYQRDLPQQCKFRWKSESKNQFVESMHDNVTATELARAEVCADDNNIEEAIEIIESVLHRAAEPMKVKTGQRKKRWLQPKWWDQECEQLKQLKYDVLRRFKTTDRIEDFNAYKEAKRDFKNHCNKKKNDWKNGLKQKIVDSKNDPSKF